jgi:hypothetical protein
MVPSFAFKLSGGWLPDIPTRSVPLDTMRASTGESEDDSAGAVAGELTDEADLGVELRRLFFAR